VFSARAHTSATRRSTLNQGDKHPDGIPATQVSQLHRKDKRERKGCEEKSSVARHLEA